MQLSKVEGGFTLTGTDEFTEEKLPRTVEVKMAYAQAKGNAFKVYEKAKVKDFKVGKGGIKCTANTDNVELLSKEDNVVRLQINKLPFRFTVRGFDPNRDLLINWDHEQL